MLVCIDHGNKQIKTASRVFTSGLVESDTRPPFGDNIMFYNGKYYTLSDQRIPYIRDKTEDDRFFILTLFAIAYEINAAGRYAPDQLMDIQLAVGLPPAHYGTQYKRFAQYFLDRGMMESNRRTSMRCVIHLRHGRWSQAWTLRSCLHYWAMHRRQLRLISMDMSSRIIRRSAWRKCEATI